MIFRKKLTAVTHSGDFHSDDIFASAVLRMVYPEIEIVRSREKDVIEKADIVFDVGQVYDPEKKRFDHHQKGGAGARSNGIGYASFGLVWKEYGERLCGNRESADMLDNKLVSPVDAIDNGIDICNPKVTNVTPYSIQNVFSLFTPVWNESGDCDKVFSELSDLALKILKREIEVAQSYQLAKDKVSDLYNNSEDKRVVVLDAQYPLSLFQDFEELMFVVYQSTSKDDWRVKAMRKNPDCFDVRKEFPAAWAGKEGAELVEATGIEGSVFAHNKRFLVGAHSKEAALKLARIALNS